MNSLLIAAQTGTKFAYIEFAEENYLRDKSHHKQNETKGRKRTIHHENSCSYCYFQLLIKERGKNVRGMQKKRKQFRHSSVLQCTLLKSSFLFFRFSLQMKYVGEKQFSSLSSKLDY